MAEGGAHRTELTNTLVAFHAFLPLYMGDHCYFEIQETMSRIITALLPLHNLVGSHIFTPTKSTGKGTPHIAS